MSVEIDGVNNIIKADTISEVTSANGVAVDGVTLNDGGAALTGNLTIDDDSQISLGASADLVIRHNAANGNSFITDAGTGGLFIQANSTLALQSQGTSENFLVATSNAGVKLYHNNNEKFETTSTGINVTGTVTGTGTSVFASLDISGDIDVDGTTNLDVVDIDGAVDIATTLGVGGVLTGTTAVFASTSADDNLVITSTDADAGDPAPDLVLYRNSSSPADGDDIGRIEFRTRNNNSQDFRAATIQCFAPAVADGSETGTFNLFTFVGGAEKNRIAADATETVFNGSSADLDFRVQSDGDTHALFVDAGNNRVGIGTASPDYTLTVRSMGSPSNDSIINIIGEATDSNCGIQFTNSGGTLKGRIVYDTDDNTLATTVDTSEVQRYLAGGQFLINRTSSNQNDHDNGNLERLGVTETSAARNSLYLSNTSGSFGGYLQRNDATRAANASYGFFIGSSGDEGDNEIRMMGDGSINSDGSNNLGSGADYAEYFEWKDGNSSSEDRRGYSVVLDGNQIVKATDSDDASKIIGVISGNPAVVGDSAWNKWNQKHLKDNFNTYIWEDYTQTEWTDADGNFISHQTDLIPDGVTAPDDAVVVSKEEDGTTNLQRRKVNPSWDSTATYVPRSDRKEWDTVGLMGKLRLKKGEPTGTNWIKMRDIDSNVEEWLVR